MTVQDELALGRLLSEYCHRIDRGDFTGVAELFTVGGSFVFGDETPSGRDELARWFEAMQPPHRRGTHISVNPIVDLDGDRAVVATEFLFVRFIKGALTIEMAGRYLDDCTRVDGRWLIERRRVEALTPPTR